MAQSAQMPPDDSVRVLLIDDDEDDAFLTRDLLTHIPGSHFHMDWEPNWEKALNDVCRGEYDVYLVDYRLGSRTGLELIREAQQRDCRAPFILLTGQSQREIDFEAMEAGAADFLDKKTLTSTLLERSIRYAIQAKQSEEELEKRVAERTAELAEANAALQREISERKRAEEALRDVDRRKDEFLATLAHELRNPLAPIRNALEIMRLGAGDVSAMDRGRRVMERQVSHMVHLINDLMDISRITRGKIQIRKEPVDLAAAVEGAVEASRPLIDAAKHELSIVLPDEPIIVDADPTRLTQILLNLLNNAAKYTDPGGKIILSAAVEKDELVIRTRDNGIGIPSEILPHIFEIFSQADRSRDRSQGGLGVGLSLVRGLVELHGGTVAVYSEGPGKGSEFIVSLPLKANDRKAVSGETTSDAGNS